MICGQLPLFCAFSLQTATITEATLSTGAVHIYLSYLQTEVIVNCIARIDKKLSTSSPQDLEYVGATLRRVRQDCVDELARRQLVFDL